MKDAVIRFRTDKPDYSDLPNPYYDWAHSVYGDGKEESIHGKSPVCIEAVQRERRD